jgi:hypothetical protein
MESQTWRYGNEDASQIIEKKIMRPHYEVHVAEYGFRFESDKVLSFVLFRPHEALTRWLSPHW